MSRRLLRPLFDLHDPFFFPTFFHRPQRLQIRHFRPIEREFIREENQQTDPHQVFQNFFNENGIKQNEEQQFFKKHYSSKVQEKFDPFKVLQISKNASQAEIKDAYRKLAIKYHPKNNSSPEAQIKFAQLAKAYQQALEQKNSNRYEDFGFKSFFEDFDRQVQQIFNPIKEESKVKQTEKPNKQEITTKNNFGELYSESSHIQNINGEQKRLVIEKKYKKDGKLLFVKRQETLKEDGKTEILETIDDGKQVKKKQYILDKNTKRAEQLE